MVMRSLKTASLLSVPVVVLAVLAVYLLGGIPYKVYVMHTGSMSPTIPTRSAVLVQQGHYHVGQVIAFREKGGVVTHRLISINADGTIDTKGDANRTIDATHVSKQAIIGGVVLAPHLVGFALVYLKTPLGAASILFSILLVWQTWALVRRGDQGLAIRTPVPRLQ